jgi:hypothetical protein
VSLMSRYLGRSHEGVPASCRLRHTPLLFPRGNAGGRVFTWKLPAPPS